MLRLDQQRFDIMLCTMARNIIVGMSKVCEATDLNELTEIVAHDGCFRMFKMCSKKSEEPVTYDFVLRFAVFYGLIDIAKLCRERGAKNIRGAANAAARYGRIEVVELFR